MKKETNHYLSIRYVPKSDIIGLIAGYFNAEIIKQGYGHAYTKFPFRYMQEFRNYEREARLREMGFVGVI